MTLKQELQEEINKKVSILECSNFCGYLTPDEIVNVVHDWLENNRANIPDVFINWLIGQLNSGKETEVRE